MNAIEEEILQCQLLNDKDIPESTWDSAKIEDDSTHFRMDILWSFLLKMKDPSGTAMFERLAKVAILVLTLPHSNAEEERVFSMVTKNKTKFRPSLKLDGTLSSILTIKLANPQPCILYEPTQAVLDSARKATSSYL